MDASNDKLYFGDVRNCRIRAVDLAAATIDTVAGGGNNDIGDGLAATQAVLSTHPMRVSLDGQGHFYISDAHQNRIRQVAATNGIITTVAGNGQDGFSGDNGPATQASLSSPHGARKDQTGNLYIADTQNNRIRKVCGQTGVITTVAGNGQDGFSGDNIPATEASLSGPLAAAVDQEGNLYIADRGNRRIRRVDNQTQYITTVAGNGQAGPLLNGVSADEALFETLRDLHFGPDEHLYIADGDNNQIARLNLAGNRLEIVAGNGAPGHAGDGGPALDANLNHPYSIAFDPDANLYIFDANNTRIRKINAASGIISTFAGTGTPGFSGDGGPATAAALGFGG